MHEVIVIVGAGFCGTVLAVNLLRRPGAIPTEIVLVERGPAMNRGVAYAARNIPYLLNVPAGRLSADSADAHQFLNFVRAQLPEADAEDFLPRSLYGDYLEDLIEQAERGAAPHLRFERIRDEVLDLKPLADRGIEIQFAKRQPMHADKVVLAVGNPAPAPLPWLESLRGHAAIRDDPWDLPKDVGEHQSVLIVGNGLTMADVALALSSDPQRVPTLHTISRRGLVPQTQTPFHPSSACGNAQALLEKSHSIRGLLKAGRELARKVESAGGDWREAVTFIRTLVPQIWRQLPAAEQARFVRHLQAQWDIHRHRLPPELAERLAQLKSAGKLRINAGRIQRAAAEGDRLRVEWRRRGRHETSSLSVDYVVNATGPDYVLGRTREPLLQSLQARGLISSDALSLGIRTDPAGACVNARGERNENIFYLGPMLRADHWEATAATELRGHAERLAERLMG